jgi:hypothetical protein
MTRGTFDEDEQTGTSGIFIALRVVGRIAIVCAPLAASGELNVVMLFCASIVNVVIIDLLVVPLSAVTTFITRGS